MYNTNYGYIVCAGENTLDKVGLNIEVNSKRLKHRPKQRWLDTLDDDLRMS